MLANQGAAPRSGDSFLSIDTTNIIIEAVKPAEDDDAIIVRLYEAERSAVSGATLAFGTAPVRVATANILEEELSDLPIIGGHSVSLDFRAFEIKTLKVYF
ncbi:glycosyl hydrolase-related protein [Paenibacillus sp. MCAF20]